VSKSRKSSQLLAIRVVAIKNASIQAFYHRKIKSTPFTYAEDSMCNFEIKVLMGLENGAASTICATRSGCVPLSKTETLPCDAFGRYVMIRRTSDVDNVGFQLCEVEVFAKRKCNGMDSDN
jgi:hypothetical protein